MTGYETKGENLTFVSTHMPLARHDRILFIRNGIILVSTHMPLARHDAWQAQAIPLHQEFLLTCLLRGMTQIRRGSADYHGFLLTCLLRGMTLDTAFKLIDMYVSTHMPLARHDRYML